VLLLGHIGITLGITKYLEVIIDRDKGIDYLSRSIKSAKNLQKIIDYRLVLIASMLPDIIDKPLGGVILKESIGNGRIYAHTFLFLLFLFGLGMFFLV